MSNIPRETKVSLFLIVDKIKRAEQISTIMDIPKDFFDELENNAPEHLKKLVREVVIMFLKKLNIAEDERDKVTDKIMTRRFSEMFALIDGYSVTKTREEERINIAKNLLLENLDLNLIVRVSKLTPEKVLELKKSLQQEGKLL